MSPPTLRSTSWSARPMVAFAREPCPKTLPPAFNPMRCAMGPFTMMSGVPLLVAVRMP
jgi:hypothetical protein